MRSIPIALLAAILTGAALAGSPLSSLVQGAAPRVPPPAPPLPPPENQAPPTSGTGAISGVVIDGVTKRPIEGALVQLMTSGVVTPGSRPRQRTDARGRFLFHRLPPSDTYLLSVSRHGYFDSGFKAPPGVAGGSRVPLRDGEWFTNGNLTMWKPAAITGSVVDEHGEAVVGATVRAIAQVPVAGRTRLAGATAVVTDDRGMFRIAGLKGGRYFVHVPSVQITLADGAAAARPGNPGSTPPEPLTLLRSPDAGRNDGLSVLVGRYPTPAQGNGATAYPMYYHPSARSLDQAEAVSIKYGETRTNVDVTIAPTSTFTVSGQVVGPSDVIAKLPVRLVPSGSEELGAGAEAALTITDQLGGFTFLRVPSGSYSLIASGTQSEYTAGTQTVRSVVPTLPGLAATSASAGVVPGAEGLRYSSRRTGTGAGGVGRVSVVVDARDVPNVTVPLQAGVTVAGHFIFDGSETPPVGLRSPPMVRLEPADGNLEVGMPFSSNSILSGAAPPTPFPFEIKGVLPGRYLFDGALGTSNLVIESIELAGQDLLTTPLAITGEREIRNIVIRMASKPMSLSGRVTQANGSVPAAAAVIVFPVERTAWRDYGITASRFRSAQVTASGSFLPPAGLPAGEYYAVAVKQDDRYRWNDADFLEIVVVRATRFRLAPGMPVTLALRFDGSER